MKLLSYYISFVKLLNVCLLLLLFIFIIFYLMLGDSFLSSIFVQTHPPFILLIFQYLHCAENRTKISF